MAAWLPQFFFFFLWCHYWQHKERSKHTLSQILASAQVWQAVMLPMSLWSNTADLLPSRLGTDCPFWFVLCMQSWYMLGLCRGFLTPPLHYTTPHTHTHTLPGTISQWSVKAAQGQDLYQMKRGSPLIYPSLTSAATWPKATRMPPENSPGFTLSSPVHKHCFTVILKDKAVQLCGSPFCVDTKYCTSLWGNYNLRVRF